MDGGKVHRRMEVWFRCTGFTGGVAGKGQGSKENGGQCTVSRRKTQRHSPDDVNAGVASFDGIVSDGARVLLHAESLGPPQLAGVKTTPLQPAKLLLIAGVVVHRELLHSHQATILTLTNNKQ